MKLSLFEMFKNSTEGTEGTKGEVSLRGDETITELCEQYTAFWLELSTHQGALNSQVEALVRKFDPVASPIIKGMTVLEERILALAKMQKGLLLDGKDGKSVYFGNVVISFRKNQDSIGYAKGWDEPTAVNWLQSNGYDDCTNVVMSINKDVVRSKLESLKSSGIFKIGKGAEKISLSVSFPDLKKIAGE